jgi:hypothetical protein
MAAATVDSWLVTVAIVSMQLLPRMPEKNTKEKKTLRNHCSFILRAAILQTEGINEILAYMYWLVETIVLNVVAQN